MKKLFSVIGILSFLFVLNTAFIQPDANQAVVSNTPSDSTMVAAQQPTPCADSAKHVAQAHINAASSVTNPAQGIF